MVALQMNASNPTDELPVYAPDAPRGASLDDLFTSLLEDQPQWVQRTISLQVYTRSSYKEAELYLAMCYSTNLIAAILKHLAEHEAEPRTDGAIAYILQNIRDRRYSARDLGDSLQKALGHHFPVAQYPIAGTLRTSAFRRCGELLLSWFARISGETIRQRAQRYSEIPADRPIDTTEFEQVYRNWRQAIDEYDQLCQHKVPFGKHRGRCLGDVGKRELRWLTSVLLDTDEAEFTLRAITILLHPTVYTRTDIEQAEQVPHPYRKNPRRKHRLEQPRIDQRGQRAVKELQLKQLSKAQLWRLHGELTELLTFRVQFDEIRTAIKRLLQPRTHHYPRLRPVLMTDDEREQAQIRYEQALDRFHKPLPTYTWRGNQPPSKVQLEKFAAKMLELEQGAINELEAAAAALQPPRLQSLSFPRTMCPDDYNAFGLLFSMQKPVQSNGPPAYRYTLAVNALACNETPPVPVRVWKELRFVNFPDQVFRQPSAEYPAGVRLFSLKCGRKYHEEQFLHQVIANQLVAPPRSSSVVKKNEAKDPPRHHDLPEARIRSARIIARQRRRKWMFYVHLTVRTPAPGVSKPTRIMGVYEYEQGYSYAVMDHDTSTLIDHGIVPIPPHVLPQEGHQHYSANYVYEVANTVIRIAKHHNALIGIDPALWKRRSTTSRSQNRRNFARPRRKVMDTVAYKTVLAGVLPAIEVHNISPVHDCSMCGYKPRKNQKREGKRQGTLFLCDRCHQQRPAHINTALVTAQRTLEYLPQFQEKKLKQAADRRQRQAAKLLKATV